MAAVDEAFWHRYYETHNDARFGDLVAQFYHPEAHFVNPKNDFRGHAAILAYLENAGRHARLTLTPTEIWVKPAVCATELDFRADARDDIPGFVTGPLKAGESAVIRMAAIYHMDGALIRRASIYWGHGLG